MTKSFSHRVTHHEMRESQAAFDAAWGFLSQQWGCSLPQVDVPAAETLGAGGHLEFFGVERDDLGHQALLARIPGNATALTALSNQDVSGILFTLHNVWFERRKRIALIPGPGQDPLVVSRSDSQG